MPIIRLKGHSLEQAGFKPGDHVEVTIEEQGILSVRLIKPQVDVISEMPWCDTSQTTCQLTLWKPNQ